MSATYIIGTNNGLRAWRSERTLYGGPLYLGEELCAGCDAPIADGPCGCDIDWAAERAAKDRALVESATYGRTR